MDNNEFSAQKPRRVRGTGIYAGDEFTFMPTVEGQPSQRDVTTCKNGKLFTTTSETKPQRVAHLSCPADAADLWAEYTERLEQLGTKPQKGTTMQTKQRIVNEAGMQVFLNQTKRQIVFQGTIDLTSTSNWQSEVVRQLQVIVRTLPVNERFKRVINNLKKRGKK